MKRGKSSGKAFGRIIAVFKGDVFFDSKAVKNEIAAMENVISQYKKDLLFGRVDPDVVLPEFLQKLKDVGSDKVQAEMQKQYDEFRAKK